MPNIRITTAPSRLTSAPRVAETLRVVGFSLAVFLLELVLAHGVAAPQVSKLVYLFAGALVIAAIFRFPLPTALLVIGLADFVFYPTYFAHQVGPISVRPQEVALASLLLVALFRPRRATWGGRAGIALLGFYAMVVISALIAVEGGTVSLTDAFNSSRALFPLSLFFVVIRLFPEAEDRRLILIGTATIAAATGVVAVLTSFGAGFGEALQAAGSQTIKAENGADGIDRVRLPGLSAGYALFWYAVVKATAPRDRKTWIWGLILVGITADIIVSFNRNMWLGIVIGLIVMLAIGGTRLRGRLVTGIGILVVATMLFVVFGNTGGDGGFVAPIIKRGSTILQPGKTSQESSLQERFKETREAWGTAQHHLLLGVGSGASFGVEDRSTVTSGQRVYGERLEPQLFLHNQYLFLILISGVPGLLFFVFFLLSPALGAFARRPRDPAITALGLGVVLIMLSAVVAIYFTVDDMTAVLGLLTGILVADATERAAKGEPSGLLS